MSAPEHLHALESEAIHIMREVAAELERPVLMFSGGKDSIVLLRLAEKAFRPGRFPFPVLHVDTGHNFPEVLEYRDRRVERARRAADRRQGPGHDRRRPRARGVGPAQARLLAQPAPDGHAARRDRGGPLRRRVRRRAPRRGARPGEGARLLLPRRARPVGPARAAARAVEPLQRPHPARRARARVPHLQLDRARRVALHRAGGARAAVDLLRPRARGLQARRHAATPCPSTSTPARPSVDGFRALPHGGRHDDHRRRPLRCARDIATVVAEIAATRVTERGETRADDRTSEAAMEDRKRMGTSDAVDDADPPAAAARHRRLRRRRQVDPDRPPAARRQAAARGHARRAAPAGTNGTPDLAAITDGLRAEREQGITIDVAYRYFTTPRRSFIIADTPGHERYTRNMVTGASTAHLAVILIDARNGIDRAVAPPRGALLAARASATSWRR